MILALDPSGNFNEGKGVTGWATLDEKTGKIVDFGTIDASLSSTITEHWHHHIELIDLIAASNKNLIVVIEDYLLYANKAQTQINSRMETPKLIGVIQHYCAQQSIELIFQTAVSVKRRWKNKLLDKKGYLKIKEYKKGATTYEVAFIGSNKLPNHIVDAIRHAVHYYSFHGKKKNTAFIYSSKR